MYTHKRAVIVNAGPWWSEVRSTSSNLFRWYGTASNGLGSDVVSTASNASWPTTIIRKSLALDYSPTINHRLSQNSLRFTSVSVADYLIPLPICLALSLTFRHSSERDARSESIEVNRNTTVTMSSRPSIHPSIDRSIVRSSMWSEQTGVDRSGTVRPQPTAWLNGARWRRAVTQLNSSLVSSGSNPAITVSRHDWIGSRPVAIYGPTLM